MESKKCLSLNLFKRVLTMRWLWIKSNLTSTILLLWIMRRKNGLTHLLFSLTNMKNVLV